MKTLGLFFRWLALLGTPFTLRDQQLSGFTGLRNRVHNLSMACCWMTKGGQYDQRTRRERLWDNPEARSYLRKALWFSPQRPKTPSAV